MGKRKESKGLSRRRRAEIRLAEERRKAERRHVRMIEKKKEREQAAAARDVLRRGCTVPEEFRLRVPADERCRDRFENLVAVAREWRPGLVCPPYLQGLSNLAAVELCGKAADWRPRGRGLTGGFRSLATQLLGGYRVSRHLLDSLLLDHGVHETWRAARLVKAAVQGESVFHLSGTAALPAPLTRRMCHLLINPDRPRTLAGAVRRAQVLAHGGGEKLAAAVGASCLGHFAGSGRELFRDEVIHWLCRQADLDPERVAAVVEFLEARHREDPGFRMKGRSSGAVVGAMQRWRKHQAELARIADRRDYARSGLASSRWKLSRREHGRDLEPDVWILQEILTPRDLVDEGRRMSHCVATFHPLVRQGASSIWSLRCNGQSRLTVEVINARGVIRQVSGVVNREPRPREARLVKGWAAKNGLTFDRYSGVQV